MAYRTTTKLDEFIKNRIEDVLKNEDKEITIKEIMEDIGNFADVSWSTIKQIKDKGMQPSLAVAMKIVEFFETTIEEMFIVEEFDNPNDVKEKKTSIRKKKPKCKIDDCEIESFARGFCNKHYQEFRNHNPEKFQQKKHEFCTEENCENLHYAKGLCSHHYNKYYRESRQS